MGAMGSVAYMYDNLCIVGFSGLEEDDVMNALIEKKIGKNIRKLRERAGLTQDQVAARLQTNGCDITRSAVAKIEVGQRHIYPDEIILLSRILSATYGEILDVL